MEAQNSFYLVDPRPLGPRYKVLWYHPLGRPAEGSTRRHRYGAVKVDILVPGTMDLPELDPSMIDFKNDRQLPTAPLSLVLLHKLRGWFERVHSPKPYYYQRHPQDVNDVALLLPIAARDGVQITDPVLPRKLVNKARRWVNQYVTMYPQRDTTSHWKKIGFRAGPKRIHCTQCTQAKSEATPRRQDRVK